MNELPRRKLSEIIAEKGRSVIDNPRRLEALLRDHCGEFRREISVLVMAVEEHAVPDMMGASAAAVPHKVLLARLARRLCDNLGLSEGAATWSIESWALALGVISEAEIKADVAEAEKGIPLQTKVTTAAAAPKGAVKSPDTAGTNQPKHAAVNSFLVAANGGGDFASIGDALRSVPANSRLLVAEGLYHESIILDKRVEIIGDGAGGKIIVRGVQSSALVMQSDRAVVRGLTLQGSGSQYGKAFFAVDILQGELILEECDVVSDSLSGVAVHGAGANPLVKNCRIHDCADSGFYIFGGARPRIEDCDIYRNANVSVAITQAAAPVLKNCRVFEGESGGVVAWGKGTAGLIESCQIYGHRLANVGVRESADPKFLRCEIYGGRDTGVFVHENGFGRFEECDVYRNSRAEVGISQNANSIFIRCAVHDGENSGIILQNRGRASIESCNIYDNADAGVSIYGESVAEIRRCNIHRNRKVAVRVKEQSTAHVEGCDLRGNFLAAWETDYGVFVEEKNNRAN